LDTAFSAFALMLRRDESGFAKALACDNLETFRFYPEGFVCKTWPNTLCVYDGLNLAAKDIWLGSKKLWAN
jgi:hypothetical protein